MQNQLSNELAQVKKLRAELARELNEVKQHARSGSSGADGSANPEAAKAAKVMARTPTPN